MPLILENAAHVLAEFSEIVQPLVLSLCILRFDDLWLILNMLPDPPADDFVLPPLLAVPINLCPREATIYHKFHGAFLIRLGTPLGDLCV